tara:strand:- start:2341 stop:2634 length:294 start_codon:yes stop_codon:yes gene_type:complete
MVEEIIKSINKLNEEELAEIAYAIKDRRDVLNYGNLIKFRIGDKVKWTHGQGLTEEHYEGEVYKINPKTIAVRVKGRAWMRWRISPSMLTKIEGDES